MRLPLHIVILSLAAALFGQSQLPNPKPNAATTFVEDEGSGLSMEGVPKGELFYVSKISPALPYTKARFDEVWRAFRAQYYLAQSGEIQQTRWAKYWVRTVGRLSEISSHSMFSESRGAPPSKSQAQFTVVDGLGPDGRPSGAYVEVRYTTRGETSKVDSDARFKRAPSGATSRLYLADRTAVCPKQFVSQYEWNFDVESDGALLQLAEMPNSKDAQDAFLAALKAGSEFRVVVPREISCSRCGGLGRPVNSRQMGAKCEYCEGAGRIKKSEIITFVW